MKQSIILAILMVIIALMLKGFLMYIAPANAQELSPYGMWEEWDTEVYDYRWQPKVKRAPKYNINPGARPVIYPEEPDIVEIVTDEEPGTVIIDTREKTLYYIIDEYNALAYPIAVGRKGFQWTGVQKVSRIENWPAWYPPEEMRQRQPGLPVKMEGGINNPLGAVAIYLGNTLYRIHGSNDPDSIGTEASSGCFRMHNEHAVHLASIVTVGTVVKVF